MPGTKEVGRDLLDRLRDDCSLEEIAYHLHARHEIEAGLADADADRRIPHAEQPGSFAAGW